MCDEYQSKKDCKDCIHFLPVWEVCARDMAFVVNSMNDGRSKNCQCFKRKE